MLKYVSILTGWSSRVADRSLLATDSMSWENIRILNQGAQETIMTLVTLGSHRNTTGHKMQ